MDEHLKTKYTFLYERHRLRLLSHAYKRTGNYHEAQDIVNETFMALCRNTHIMENEQYSGAWLTYVCNMKIMDYFREYQWKQVNIDAPEYQKMLQDLTSGDNIEEWIESVEQEEMIHYAWEELRKKDERKYRMLLDMTYAEHMTVDEMAAKHGVTKAAFTKNVERARKYMAKTMDAYRKTLREKYDYVYD